MAFVTVAQLRTRLASTLRIEQQDRRISSVSPWQQILVDTLDWGYQEILSRLRRRGYTKTQIDTWARGSEFNVSISLFWALTQGAGLHNYDDTFINKFDRREELDTVEVLDSSAEEIDPAGSRLVGSGKLSTTGDLFQLDPDDPRRGEVTEW